MLQLQIEIMHLGAENLPINSDSTIIQLLEDSS